MMEQTELNNVNSITHAESTPTTSATTMTSSTTTQLHQVDIHPTPVEDPGDTANAPLNAKAHDSADTTTKEV
jgi:hypothetical protein